MDNTLLISLIMVLTVIIVIPVYINVTKKKQGRNKTEGRGSLPDTRCSYSDAYVVGEKKEPTADDVKARIRILFVDDKDDFPIIGMLRNNGYQVEYLDDIVDFDAKQVKFADIIFLDINGVGVAMKFKNQGMGLCGALRDYFGKTKKLILYSGETEGSIFDKDAKKADATLPKDSDLYQFTSYITQYGKELLEKVS